MSGANHPSAPTSEVFYGRDDSQDLELWKHHANFGGEDKNRMVAISSWLLSFSAAILWYVAVRLIAPNALELNAPFRALIVSTLGISVSIGSGYITLLYGGYSNRNWQKADDIAESRGWKDLFAVQASQHPQAAAPAQGLDDHSRWDRFKHRFNAIAWRWAHPCKPKENLPPVFAVFLVAAGFSCLGHLVILIWSLVQLVG
jgi:hypothetical protein